MNNGLITDHNPTLTLPSMLPPNDHRSLSQEQQLRTRKTFKKMMFLYVALLNGWHIHMLDTGQFQMYRGSTDQ
jgi:hypothetical protein